MEDKLQGGAACFSNEAERTRALQEVATVAQQPTADGRLVPPPNAAISDAPATIRRRPLLSHTWGIGDKVTVDYGGKLEPGQIVKIMGAKSKAKLHITVFFESDDSNAILKTLLEHKLMKLGVPVFLDYAHVLCTME